MTSGILDGIANRANARLADSRSVNTQVEETSSAAGIGEGVSTELNSSTNATDTGRSYIKIPINFNSED